MNAILQCFVHTPLIRNYFISGLFKNHIEKGKGETLANAMAKFVTDYELNNEPLSSLRNIKDAIDKYIPQFQGYNQHDAQEFLAMLIDKLTAELTIKISVKLSKTLSSTDSKTSSSNKTTETDEGTLNVSVMANLFSGELCSTIICPCSNSSNKKKEPFYYLSIPLPQHVIALMSIEYVFGVYMFKKRGRERDK